MKILCLLFLLLGPAEGVDRTAVHFLANFWLSVAGFASVFIVLVSIWLDFWIRSDQRTEEDELKEDEIIELSRVENEVVAENCVVEVEEKPPVLPPPPPPPAPTTPPPPPPPASLHRHPVARKRRDRIPKKSEMKLNLLELLSAIGGQSLTRVSMPIIYNEPISMLQRLCEMFEFSNILDTAAGQTDPYKQLMYVAAFAVAGYGRAGRTLKPFNPLLGETFELDRTSDLGWRYISEQVSHHPPIAAVHCEGRGWTVWLQVSSDVKFTGRTISVEPKGSIHLVFKGSNHHYTWERLHTVIHNVLFGKLWIENHGEMNIINHTQGGRAFVKFESSGMFGGETKQVYGAVHNAKQEIVWILRGAWDSFLESVSPQTAVKVEGEVDIFGKEIANENVVAKLPRWKEVWDGRPEDVRTEIQYCFTQFTIELNEPEDGVAPTDSRNRPDQRIHENGDWKKADRCKYELEAAQRARKKETSTVWFQKTWDQYENDFVYKSKGTYWKKKQEKNWEPTQIFDWNDGSPPKQP